MWLTNLKILGVTLVVVAFYTAVAHVIPQLHSEVPEGLTLTAGMTPEALVAAGERVFNTAGGCTACHGLGTRAPNLLTDHKGEGPIGARCGKRKPGMDCKAYLYESLVAPAAYVVAGFDPIMPDMRKQLSNEQIWALIAYLQSQGGDVTVTPDDVKKTAPGGQTAEAGPATGAAAPPVPGGAIVTGTMDPVALYNEKGCVACHQLDGKGGVIGPSWDHIGRRRTADQIRRKILFPARDTTKGYEKFAGMMPPTFGKMLSAAQLEALVEFMAARK